MDPNDRRSGRRDDPAEPTLMSLWGLGRSLRSVDWYDAMMLEHLGHAAQRVRIHPKLDEQVREEALHHLDRCIELLHVHVGPVADCYESGPTQRPLDFVERTSQVKGEPE